jgi:3-oxoacyl-[acyl-carrier-protein] synthase II
MRKKFLLIIFQGYFIVKITFVYPRFEKFLTNNPELDRGLVEYFLGDFTTPPSLGIPILASLTPPEFDMELLDDNAGDPIDFSAPTDLVAINCFTPQATRAFEIADGFRAQGKKVIMGGFFPSFMAEECLLHADSVNTGEGEPTWPVILSDLKAGGLKKIYKGGCSFNMADMKIPRRDLFYKKDYYDWDEDLVQLTRGCSYTCAMCAIPAHMGSRIRFRPIEKVVEEIRQLKYENVYLADDTLFFTQRKMMEYSRSLLKALIPIGKKYFVSSTMALNTDGEFLDLMAKAGVKNFYCTLNVDPVSIKALAGERKERQMLFDLVKKLTDHDIRFFGSCAVGRDWDEQGIGDKVVDLFDKAGIHTSEFFLFTPYPGSVHWDRLSRQDRIVDRNWSHYNGAHVVFEPLNMTRDELYREFIGIWNNFYKLQKDSHSASLEPATWKNGRRSVGKPLERQGVKGQAVVTGIGALSPIGCDVETITAALKEGKHGLAPITLFDASPFRTNLGGEIRGFNAKRHLDEMELLEYDDKYLHYAIASARRAMADAGWGAGKPKQARRDIALVLGTCNGGLLSAEEEYKWLHKKSGKVFDEKMNLQAQYYGFGKALSRALGIGGEVWVVTTACSSTTGALGLAASLVNLGLYATVIVGGSDTLCVANMSGFNGLKAVSTGQTAPFSLPVGLNVGEASVFWVLEEMEQALLRHARIYGKIAGHALTSDAYHPTSPDPRGEGVYKTLTNALRDAGITLQDIGCINAHGTGTEANDRAESKGIAKFCQTTPIPVTSTKSFFGHCMGTTGILEATCNLLSMNRGFIPPTLNFSGPRPGCTLDYVPNTAREKEYNAFISANYAFGGNNAGVVMTQWDFPLPPRNKDYRRVVVTGLGTVTSLGLGIGRNLDALRNGAKGIGPASRLGYQNAASKLAGLVPEFSAQDIDRRLDFAGMNLLSRYAAAASRLALDHAGLRVGPKNADDIGIVMGVCNGPPESDHMNSVFASDNFLPDINCFSNIVANSTAGWVSNALCLKGVNMTLAPGPHAGMASIAWAFNTLRENRAKAVLAAASDEVYYQMFYNYNLIGFLKQGSAETAYDLDLTEAKRKVIAEGAATIVLETLDSARERGAKVIAEVLSYGMSADGQEFAGQELTTEGLAHACETALSRANLAWRDIGLAVWAPQGNVQDQKALTVLHKAGVGHIPLAATTFNTGYIETASIVVAAACALESLMQGHALWPQITGVPDIDKRQLSAVPKHVMALASTDLGYNYAVIFKTGSFLS